MDTNNPSKKDRKRKARTYTYMYTTGAEDDEKNSHPTWHCLMNICQSALLEYLKMPSIKSKDF